MPNAFLSAPDPNVTLFKKCSVFPVEFVGERCAATHGMKNSASASDGVRRTFLLVPHVCMLISSSLVVTAEQEWIQKQRGRACGRYSLWGEQWHRRMAAQCTSLLVSHAAWRKHLTTNRRRHGLSVHREKKGRETRSCCLRVCASTQCVVRTPHHPDVDSVNLTLLLPCVVQLRSVMPWVVCNAHCALPTRKRLNSAGHTVAE